MGNPYPFTPLLSNEEDEDTLSLSNLAIYCDQNIEFWVEDQSMSCDIEQDFEFSSEMMISSHDSSHPVVFCGKVIHVSPQNIQKFESEKHQRHCKHPEKGKLTRKMSIITSKTKSKWYLFMFGFGSSNFPKKMHIGELRKRQTSLQRKCSEYGSCDTSHGNRARSRGFLRFLGCVSGNNEIYDQERPLSYFDHLSFD